MSRRTTFRPTYVSRQDCEAECQDCSWNLQNRSALGTAARHHDSTGHTVRVEVTRAIYYGRRPGQTP